MTQQRFIDEIKISGFKSIKELTLPLGKLNVFIGANGAGKSNFIGVFSLLNHIAEHRLQNYVSKRGASSLLYYGRKTTTEIKVALSYADKTTGYKFTLAPNDQDSLFFSDERCLYHNKVKYPKPFDGCLGTNHQETKLDTPPDCCINVAPYVLSDLKNWKLYHFHDTSENSPMKQTTPIADNRSLKSNANNLAAFLYFLKHHQKSSYTEIVKTVQLAAPFFLDFLLEPVPENPNNVRLEWWDTKSDAYFNSNMLSDGTLRFICLTTLLLQPQLPSVIVLDEPELGLHPAAIALLAEMIKSASQKSQVVISTQSITLINHFAPEEIIVAERKADTGESLFKRLEKKDIEQWLEEYALGVIWEKNIIGGRP